MLHAYYREWLRTSLYVNATILVFIVAVMLMTIMNIAAIKLTPRSLLRIIVRIQAMNDSNNQTMNKSNSNDKNSINAGS